MRKYNKSDLINVWVTSDLHFGHDKDFIYKARGFSSVKEHDEQIIERWNALVEPNHEVWILGDIMLGDNSHGLECLSKLRGIKHIILGNHDTSMRQKLYTSIPDVDIVGHIGAFKVNSTTYFLTHYPMITDNNDDRGSYRTIDLFGHTHSKELFYGDNLSVYNVALDAHYCYPCNLSEIHEDIIKKGGIN